MIERIMNEQPERFLEEEHTVSVGKAEMERRETTIFDEYIKRSFVKVGQLVEKLQGLASGNNDREHSTAARITTKAFQLLSSYTRVITGASVIAGALLLHPHSGRSFAEEAARAEVVRKNPRKEYSVQKMIENGREVFKHESVLTNDTIQYLSGSSELPAYVKEGLLKEELAYRMFVADRINPIAVSPEQLADMSLPELEQVYLVLKQVDGGEQVERAVLDQLYKPMVYDPKIERALWEIEQVCGNPRLYLYVNTPYYNAFIERGKMPSVAAVIEYKANNRSSTNFTTNTIGISYDHLDDKRQKFRILFGEFAHAFQGKSDYAGVKLRALNEDRDIAKKAASAKVAFEKMYDELIYNDKGSLEDEAHNRIQPDLERLFARKVQN